MSGDTLGLYVTGHPIDEYREEVRKFAPTELPMYVRTGRAARCW